jgi:hypothetical protein
LLHRPKWAIWARRSDERTGLERDIEARPCPPRRLWGLSVQERRQLRVVRPHEQGPVLLLALDRDRDALDRVSRLEERECTFAIPKPAPVRFELVGEVGAVAARDPVGEEAQRASKAFRHHQEWLAPVEHYAF